MRGYSLIWLRVAKSRTRMIWEEEGGERGRNHRLVWADVGAGGRRVGSSFISSVAEKARFDLGFCFKMKFTWYFVCCIINRSIRADRSRLHGDVMLRIIMSQCLCHIMSFD